MTSKKATRPGSDKKRYWQFGEQLSQRARRGEIIRDVLRELNDEYEGTNFRPVDESIASKLKRAYETYIEKFDFSVDELEDISALDLNQAYGKLRGIQIVNNRQDAEKLIDRLKAGETFNQIRKSYSATPRTRSEHVIDNVDGRLQLLKTTNRKELKEIKELTNDYRMKIRSERDDSTKAERLLLSYILELAELHIDKK